MSALVGAAGPCIALLELSSLVAAYPVADALLKTAEVELLHAGPVSPGKSLLLFAGPVEAVTASLRAGVEEADDALLDRLFIPNVEPSLLALARGHVVEPRAFDAVGAIETLTVASTIVAGDVASKTASIELLSLGLARGLGGKSWITFTGEVSDVSAALDAGVARAEEAGLLVRRVLIPRPHAELAELLVAGVPLT